MTPLDIAPIVVAVVAALGAIAAQRASSRTSKSINKTSGRLDAEKNAYERARVYDTDTIERQREELSFLRKVNADLRAEIRSLEKRLKFIETMIPNLERYMNDQSEQKDDYQK